MIHQRTNRRHVHASGKAIGYERMTPSLIRRSMLDTSPLTRDAEGVFLVAPTPRPATFAQEQRAIRASLSKLTQASQHYGGVTGHVVERPIGTVTSRDHHSLVTAHMTRLNRGDSAADAIGEPLRTITAGGNHHALTRAFLTKFYGTNRVGQSPINPLDAVTAKDRFGLVMVNGTPHVIADIGLRMLAPRELYRAQGFPDDYRIEIPFNGKRLSRAAQVKMCGNSVCPQVAEALVRANFPAEISPRKRRRTKVAA